MSEPRTRAARVDSPRPGLWHWWIDDERIGFRSDAYAVDTPGGRVAVDPLPLVEPARAHLAPVLRICITGAFHQRAAWSLAAAWGAEVWAPDGAAPLDGTPDRRYGDGHEVAPGLVARHRPGPHDPHYVLEWRPSPGPPLVFTADLVVRASAERTFRFATAEHQRVAGRTRASVARLLADGCAGLCAAHGGPLFEGAERALERVLAGPGG